MRRGHETAWGAVYFGFKPDDGFAAGPGLTTPDSWKLHFISEHCTPEVLQGLFRSCRTGRDWVLQNAPQLRVNLSTGCLRAKGLKYLGAALAVRGSKAVSLVVECHNHDADRIALLAGGLLQSGEGVQCLSLQFPQAGCSRSGFITTALQDLAEGCPRYGTAMVLYS
jgi:hypothetical protein